MTRLDENALLRSQLAELEVSLQALKEENAMLRDEANEMRRWAKEAARAENLNAQDARRVKEQIVEWLREPGEYVDPACARLADAIERGAYCREEGA